MTETEAREAIASIENVPRETISRLDILVDQVISEADAQNLIAKSTQPNIWVRHILDSAQLIKSAPFIFSTWLDLGSGAGFPGLVIAALSDANVTLVESRKRRAEFLEMAAVRMGLTNVEIVLADVGKMPERPFDVISARAFAPLPKLFSLAHRFSRSDTRWLLPKGKSASAELEAVAGTWQGEFRIVPSLTDPEAAIIVAEHVRPASIRGARAGKLQ